MSDPIVNVPAAAAGQVAGSPLIIRVGSADDWRYLEGIAPERIVWVEVSPVIALSGQSRGWPLDIVLADPLREASKLYALARQHEGYRVRITIPPVAGAGAAAQVAMALQFPVRLLPGQPTPDEVRSLVQVFDRYLHDPRASQPMEFFHSFLAAVLHGHDCDLWGVLEHDPDQFMRIADGGDTSASPQTPGFVARHLGRLTAAGKECAGCTYTKWCAGYFKWPNPDYDCVHVKRLLGEMVRAADQLRRDLDELEAMPS